MAFDDIKLSKSWTNMQAMWSSSDATTNISMNQLANLTGVNASIPDVAQPPMGTDYSDINLKTFSGLNKTLRGGITGFKRIMKDSSEDGDLCNTIFVTISTSYYARSFMSGNTYIWKNGTLLTTITTARAQASLGTLAVGDRISFSQPIAFYHTTNPGHTGLYAGYAGYCFATRRDRYTKTFTIFNLGQGTLNYDVQYTTTSNSNVTSLSNFTNGTISVTGSYATFATATTGNYFILTDQLAVVHQGYSLSSDNVQLYPMSVDTKYGWFSQNGHTFGVNNNQEGRADAGGGDTIKGRASDGTVNTIATLGTGRDNCYANDGVGAGLGGGARFNGNACAVYGNDGSGAAGIASTVLFTCESQADGDGGEMTSFTAAKAHARGTVSGGGAAWSAFVTAGWSGSTATYPLYTDVIMRFDEDGIFKDAKGFESGSTGPPPLSKAYWQADSAAGDWFLSTVSVQGYQDTDATDKDEENMLMSHDITHPDVYSYEVVYSTGAFQGWDNCVDACENYGDGTLTEVDSPSIDILDVGSVIFNQDSPQRWSTPKNGEQMYFIHGDADKNIWCIQVDYNGIIMSKTAC